IDAALSLSLALIRQWPRRGPPSIDSGMGLAPRLPGPARALQRIRAGIDVAWDQVGFLPGLAGSVAAGP
ncbi:MAG: hypothetical protein Q7U14_11550, partial [Lacisediminimonas sp.]|nr:hypothetical protein [Lacisediminimonas sp.]